MKKILVPIDGSKNSLRAFAKAIETAKNNKSSIFALHIVIMSPSIALGTPKTIIKKEVGKKIAKLLESAKKKCQQNDIPFESKVIYGSDPGYDIVKFANSHRFEMIVMGARGLNTLKKIFLGSASDYTLKKAKAPVFVVK